jgi:hypothetical protein
MSVPPDRRRAQAFVVQGCRAASLEARDMVEKNVPRHRTGGDLEAPEMVCADVLTKYEHEVKGPLDFRGSGVNRHTCFGGAHPRDK